MNKVISPCHLLNKLLEQRPITVHVIGAGGTGSGFLQKLLQMHSTLTRLDSAGFQVTVFDDDTVSETNIGRQSFYPFDVGLPKAQVLVERYRNFASVNWTYKNKRYSFDADFTSPDILVTCVDNPATRVEIGKRIRKCHKFTTCMWLDGGNDMNSGQVVLGVYPSDGSSDKRIPSVYDLFTDSLENNEFVPTDSCSHEDAISKQDFGINDQISAQMIQIIWRLIRHGELSYHGVFVDMQQGEHTPMPVNPLNWQIMGYEPEQEAS